MDVERTLRESGAEILVSYLPVGSTKAAHAYAEACLAAGVSLVNCMPVFVVSDPQWGERFRAAGIPCAGDDIKSQVGATILHRMVVRLFAERGVRVERTYQLNTGGNTDFLNMLSRERLASKKISKTEAVTSQLPVRARRGQRARRTERLRAVAARQQGVLPARRGHAASAARRSSSRRGSRCRIRRTPRAS